MTGTGQFPRIDAEPESVDPAPRRPFHAVVGLLLVASGAGYLLAGDWVGALVAATFAAFPVLVSVAAWYGPEQSRRVEALEARASRAEQDRADLFLRITEVSSRQRNHELDRHRDELAEQRAKRGQT